MNNSVKIQHVDSEISNYYDEKRHTIIIDEKLVEYPKAHRFVLEHELEHSEVDETRLGIGALKNAWIDTKEAYNIALKWKEAVKELDEYRDEVKHVMDMRTLKLWFNHFIYIVILLFVCVPLGVIYFGRWIWRQLRK